MSNLTPDAPSLQAQALAIVRASASAAGWTDEEMQARLVVMALGALSDAARSLKNTSGQVAHEPTALRLLEEAGGSAEWALNSLRPEDGVWSSLRLDSGFIVDDRLGDVLISLLALAELTHRDLSVNIRERLRL